MKQYGGLWRILSISPSWKNRMRFLDVIFRVVEKVVQDAIKGRVLVRIERNGDVDDVYAIKTLFLCRTIDFILRSMVLYKQVNKIMINELM